MRRGSGSSLGRSSGDSIYGSAWSGSGTRADPIVEHRVQVNILEPTSSEEERDVHVAENVRPVPVRVPTPGLSRPSLAEHLGVNYDLWRNNGGTLDGDQSGSDGWAGVSEGVRRVIRGDPPVLSRTCSGGVQTCLKVQGSKGQVRQVAINYPSVACVPECESKVTRKVYKVS